MTMELKNIPRINYSNNKKMNKMIMALRVPLKKKRFNNQNNNKILPLVIQSTLQEKHLKKERVNSIKIKIYKVFKTNQMIMYKKKIKMK